jgi:Flp pilus assembly protein TadG
MKTPRHAERGAALIEFAILLPFLTTLVLGSVEVGRYAYYSIAIANAAKAGVAYAAQAGPYAGSSAGITAAVDADFNAGPAASLTVTPSTSCPCWDGADYENNSSGGTGCSASVTCSNGQHLAETVTVTVSGTEQSLFQYPVIPTSFTITQSATQRIAQ